MPPSWVRHSETLQHTQQLIESTGTASGFTIAALAIAEHCNKHRVVSPAYHRLVECHTAPHNCRCWASEQTSAHSERN